MSTEKVKKPNAIAVMIVATVLLATAALTMTNTGNVYAYSKNQATSSANACGNGQEPTNVGCQNTGSEIQGDENSVAITAQQTFPPVVREEPATCVECFTRFLSPDEQAEFLRVMHETFANIGPDVTLQDICDDFIVNTGSIDGPGGSIEQVLGAGVPGAAAEGMNLDQDRIDEIIDCLHRVLGF